MESIINHSHDRFSMVILTCVSFMIPTLARHERLHKVVFIASLLFQFFVEVLMKSPSL